MNNSNPLPLLPVFLIFLVVIFVATSNDDKKQPPKTTTTVIVTLPTSEIPKPDWPWW